MTDDQIDDGEFADLQLQGAIVFTSFDNKFEYLPATGFGSGQSMYDIIPFNIRERRIAIPDRKRPFKFRYIEGGEEYEARFFTRVQQGNIR